MCPPPRHPMPGGIRKEQGLGGANGQDWPGPQTREAQWLPGITEEVGMKSFLFQGV